MRFKLDVLILSLGRCNCWWTINCRRYHPPSNRCICTDIVYVWNLQYI